MTIVFLGNRPSLLSFQKATSVSKMDIVPTSFCSMWEDTIRRPCHAMPAILNEYRRPWGVKGEPIQSSGRARSVSRS